MALNKHDLENIEQRVLKRMKEKIKAAIENDDLSYKECIEYIKYIINGVEIFADILE